MLNSEEVVNLLRNTFKTGTGITSLCVDLVQKQGYDGHALVEDINKLFVEFHNTNDDMALDYVIGVLDALAGEGRTDLSYLVDWNLKKRNV